MRLTRTLAVVSGSLIIAAGATFTVQAAGPEPVTLCANVKTGAVSVPPSSGECGKGTTAVSLASDAALDALRQNDQAQTAAIAALEEAVTLLDPGEITIVPRPAEYAGLEQTWDFSAEGLDPESALTFTLNPGPQVLETYQTEISDSGSANGSVTAPIGSGVNYCGMTLTVSGTTVLGSPLSETSAPIVC